MPRTVTINAQNKLVVSDSGNFKVHKYELDGTFLSSITFSGTSALYPYWGASVSGIMPDGNYIVNEYNNGYTLRKVSSVDGSEMH
ncbi:MAG: hypothetical protein H7328_11830 [Bdellovibrio sp.]|nr:hypothetical protein [Bdellovibrio sp.]